MEVSRDLISKEAALIGFQATVSLKKTKSVPRYLIVKSCYLWETKIINSFKEYIVSSYQPLIHGLCIEAGVSVQLSQFSRCSSLTLGMWPFSLCSIIYAPPWHNAEEFCTVILISRTDIT